MERERRMSFLDLAAQSEYYGADVMTNFNKLLSTTGDPLNMKFGTLETTGNVGIGVTATELLHIQGTSGTTALVHRISANDYGPAIDIRKSRGSVGSEGAVVDNDDLGSLIWRGHDGTDAATIGAKIKVEVDGTPGSNDMPTEMHFYTNAGAASETLAMTIGKAGDVSIPNGFLNLGSDESLTISSGAVTASKSRATIDTEGAAASDDLATINGGTNGDLLIVHQTDSSRDITFKDGTGNLLLAGDYTPGSDQGYLTLLKIDGTYWKELSRGT